MKPLRSLLCAAFAVLSTAAAAHDLVLIPAANQALTVRYGHVGDWLSVDTERLLELTAYSTDRPERALRSRSTRRGIDLAVPGAADRSATLIAGRYDNGAWVTIAGADGKPQHRNASRFMVPDARSSLWSIKYAKGLFGSLRDEALYKREVGHWLEIIPQRNPAALKPGDELPVLVRFDGKPLPNAQVELGDFVTKIDEERIVRYTADASGIARIPIRRRGLQLLAVDLERPLSSTADGSLGEAAKKLGVDSLLIVATYVFRL